MEKELSKPDSVQEGHDQTPSASVFLNESPKKCNLSFSFNFDFDDVNSDNSSDSENADLQIDVSEVDNYEPSSKHKRDTMEESSSVLNEMEEEIERQLDAKAAKTNLTATNVKNILKHVITNEHVMAMVQKRLHDVEDEVIFEPKLTRARAKELAAAQVNIPWPITPVKKASSEVQVLIEQELPEDSSDEEYNPEQDKQSDDDREVENSTNSDIDSQPATPANPCDVSSIEQSRSPDIRYDPDGIFKIPGIPLAPTEEESIGQRTRSKLCLSETSLEQIEQAFIPPDITTDMYNWDCEGDEDWRDFLKEFTQPLTQEHVAEDDPEADPEYNILEDEETEFLDKEELRADKAVKVTRKELNNLIAELIEFTDTFSKQEQEISRKKKSPDNSNSSSENNSLNCSMADLLPAITEPELPKLVNPEQRHLLATQIRQHVQLMAQHFVMTFMHPDLHAQSKICKQNLNSLSYLSSGPNSAFNAANLTEALKLISDWENKFLDEKFMEDFRKTLADEESMKRIYLANKWKYIPKFHPELEKLILESKALMYPHLLPEIPFRSELSKHVRTPYLKSEENLVSLGLEQFLPFVASKPRKFKSKKIQLVDAAQLIIQYLVPCREPQGLLCYIQKRRCAKDLNPIKHYFEKGCAPRTIHYITLEYEVKAPKDQPIDLLPARWQTFLNAEHKIDLLKRKHILNSYNDIMKKSYGTNGSTSKTFCNIQPACNTSVNLTPKVLTTKEKRKVLNNTERRHVSCERKNIYPSSRVSLNTTHGTDHSKKMSNNKSYTVINNNESKSDTLALHGKGKEIGTNREKDHATESDSVMVSDVTRKTAKISKKSNEVLQESPQLRKTTPRLAKTRSAQNMKLMVQVLGSKGLSSQCNGLKSREKHELDKNVEKDSVLSKVDDEEEIAELMLASTTIKKDSVSRKKAKEARELENVRRLLESENPLCEEERESKFAASYLQKLHLTLESNNPETFRAVVKLCLDYNEKLDNINQMENEIPFSGDSKSLQTEEIMEEIARHKDTIIIDLYRDVCTKLKDYPDLCSDFLLFLKPHQAAMIGKSVEHMMLQKMSDFVNVAQIYFAKQPSRIGKLMQAITQLSSDPRTTLENVYAVMAPILKGHPLVMDLFLQVLPTAKPPESLFAQHMFENLTCPVGPHDKNKVYPEDAPELYENIELPVLPFQEDPYGGENCRCNCHNVYDTNFKNSPEHCVSCGTRFLNGRIYLQTSEGLRPAKITFPGADEEKLENIARVSLKTTDKFIPPTPSRQRRKSSKNESSQEELCQKQCAPKTSPVKDNEESEKAVPRTKKTAKSPPKSTDQRRPLKRSGSLDQTDVNKRIRVSQCKNKREKKTEKVEGKSGYGDPNTIESPREFAQTASVNCSKEATKESMLNVKSHIQSAQSPGRSIESHSQEAEQEGLKMPTKRETANDSSLSDEDIPSTEKEDTNTAESHIINTKPWSRQEDMILLQTIKKEFSESSLAMVSETLGDRSFEQVKERCETLLSLLQKMM